MQNQSSKMQIMHYKEVDPSETVHKLKKILDDLKIEIVEEWQKKSSIDTWALRITVKGTNYGANGKGVSRLYAQASAYAEFFERYQNDILGDLDVTTYDTVYPFKIYHDEKLLSAEEIVNEDNDYIKMFFSCRNQSDLSLEEKAMQIKRTQRLDYLYYGCENQYISIPYYSCRDEKITYLPRNVYRLSYGSNGMSAGNTFEEAIVQGLSEIIERYVQRKIITEKVILPNIPEEYVKRFPNVYQMLMKLRKNENYICLLKDCSFGGKYPVAALIVLEKNSGRYGIKLGCHPDYGVAMERAFTEATQGQDIFQYSTRSKFDFSNKNVEKEMNIYNTFKTGKGQFPYQVFGERPAFKFKEIKDISHLSNAEIMTNMINQILVDGYDILIRDVSYLGFPSVHIIVPGMSEMFVADDRRYRIYNTRFYVCELLKHPAEIDETNIRYILSTLEYFLPSEMENTIDTYYNWCNTSKLPFAQYGLGTFYLIAMCYVYMEEFDKALQYIKAMLEVIDVNDKSQFTEHDEILFLRAVFYYLEGIVEVKEIEILMEYMNLLFSQDICNQIVDIFKNPKQVIVKQYPCIQIDEEKVLSAENIILKDIREELKRVQQMNTISQDKIGERLNSMRWKNGRCS